ncbi:MAG: replicative DNA helicase [Clostridiales bacterium]|nr:replicative DNA helicase [Clostridiales bacterium]
MAESFVNLNGVTEPYNLEAEKAVLGSVLKDTDCLPEVQQKIKSEHFFLPLHRSIFEAMIQVESFGHRVDPLVILEELKKENILDDKEGKKYFLELAESVPSTRNVGEYCDIVVDYYYRRILIKTMQKILDNAEGETESTDNLIELAEQQIYDIRKDRAGKGLTAASDVILQELYPRFQALQYDENQPDADPAMVERKNQLKALSTGFSYLDKKLAGGLHKSDLVVIGARPGMGKTALALNMARNIAFAGKKVAFFSLEMANEQLAQRLLSTESRIPSEILRTGEFGNEEWGKIAIASDAMCKMNLFFDDTAGITVPEIKARTRRLKDVDCVFVDYIGLMQSSRKNENRVNEVSDITRNLKMMAKDLNIPVVACSQLNREAAKGNRGPNEGKKPNHRPQLTDLRESGSIEQDADIILMIHRDDYYNNGPEEDIPAEDTVVNIAEIIVAKNRHGETGTVEVAWNEEFTRFSTLERIRDDQ